MARARSHAFTLGVISDTHGLLRPEAVAALAGADGIVHAGDIGGPEVLVALKAIAPLTAIAGNNDRGDWARRLRSTATLEVEGARIHVIHALQDLAIDLDEGGFAALIAGHSHRPVIEERGGVLFVNPGSAGPRRFKLPVTVARLEIRSGRVSGRLVPLLP